MISFLIIGEDDRRWLRSISRCLKAKATPPREILDLFSWTFFLWAPWCVRIWENEISGPFNHRRRTTFSFCECVGVGSEGIIVVFPTPGLLKRQHQNTPRAKGKILRKFPKKEELETPLKIARVGFPSLFFGKATNWILCQRETWGVERDFVFLFSWGTSPPFPAIFQKKVAERSIVQLKQKNYGKSYTEVGLEKKKKRLLRRRFIKTTEKKSHTLQFPVQCGGLPQK